MLWLSSSCPPCHAMVGCFCCHPTHCVIVGLFTLSFSHCVLVRLLVSSFSPPCSGLFMTLFSPPCQVVHIVVHPIVLWLSCSYGHPLHYGMVGCLQSLDSNAIKVGHRYTCRYFMSSGIYIVVNILKISQFFSFKSIKN